MYFLSSFLTFMLSTQLVNTTNLKPVVLLHGIASDAENTKELADWIAGI